MKYLIPCILAALSAHAADVDQLSFFSGCWSMTAPDGSVVEEAWLKPSGGTLSGVGRTVKSGKATFSEFLQIREEKGVLTYFAVLRLGGTATPFPATKVSDTEVIFSNPQHDYPTTIIYRRQSTDRLFARVEGQQNGKLVGEDFAYHRVKCD
jgi:hypothetical protein